MIRLGLRDNAGAIHVPNGYKAGGGHTLCGAQAGIPIYFSEPVFSDLPDQRCKECVAIEKRNADRTRRSA